MVEVDNISLSLSLSLSFKLPFVTLFNPVGWLDSLPPFPALRGHTMRCVRAVRKVDWSPPPGVR